MKLDKKEIDLINNIIRQAVYHGGDAGGAYFSNETKLIKAISQWLSYKGIYRETFFKTTEKVCEGSDYEATIPPRIEVKKHD